MATITGTDPLFPSFGHDDEVDHGTPFVAVSSWHKSLTVKRVMAAAERQMFGTDNPGFCTACGHEQDGCEPDARNYECESCGEPSVYGASELLMEIV